MKDPGQRQLRRRRFHLAFTLFFLLMIPVSLMTGLKYSVPFLVFLSLWALVAGHWSAYEASIPPVAEEDETG